MSDRIVPLPVKRGRRAMDAGEFLVTDLDAGLISVDHVALL